MMFVQNTYLLHPETTCLISLDVANLEGSQPLSWDLLP